MPRKKIERPGVYKQKAANPVHPTVNDAAVASGIAHVKFTGKYAKRRQELYDKIYESYPQFKDDMIFQTLAGQFALFQEEEERLRKFIDTKGLTYVKYDKAMNESYHPRPEGAILHRLRNDITRVGKQLLMFERNIKEEEKDDAANLLA